ncbi:XdhC family protein [Rhodococcus fascians]|nr:XdhC family protein [Rhodococcus fascians]MBY4237931.1 XdhC family protein [Rhodococcus fascians]MBY4253318.1 XdhC family protein [Rhodococcus fascians]MBY4268955.1 XdhC family protein [Rhodococcus fascians]
MESPFDVLARSWRDDTTIAVATVVETFSSSPRLPGAMMAVDEHGAVTGSISGGCVEASVYASLIEVRDGPEILARERYGVSGEDAFAVGLTCGGTIDIVLQKFSRRTHPHYRSMIDAVENDRPAAHITIIEHSNPEMIGRTVVVGEDWYKSGPLLTNSVPNLVQRARDLMGVGEPGTVTLSSDTESWSAFVAPQSPRPLMLIFGAVDFARALAVQGSQLGYKVVVCDARATFATHQRFPAADEVVVDWPHRYVETLHRLGRLDCRTVVCVLTHDPKFDDELLDTVLRIPTLAYVGALGSRRTHQLRLQSLRDRGLGQQELERLRSPIGLDLGARTPDETAVSIAAEILANRYSRSARALSDTDGRIHAQLREGDREGLANVR